MLQPSSATNIDTVFSSSHYHGVVPAESTVKLKVVHVLLNRFFQQKEYSESQKFRPHLSVNHGRHDTCFGNGIVMLQTSEN